MIGWGQPKTNKVASNKRDKVSFTKVDLGDINRLVESAMIEVRLYTGAQYSHHGTAFLIDSQQQLYCSARHVIFCLDPGMTIRGVEPDAEKKSGALKPFNLSIIYVDPKVT